MRPPSAVLGDRFPRVWGFMSELGREMREDRVSDLAASTSFFSLLMLPAAVLTLVASLGSLDGILGEGLAADARQASLDWVADTFGSESGPISDAVAALFDQSNGGLATLSLLVALWALSRGFAGLVRALDEAYDIEERRSWWMVRLTGLGLGVGTIAVVAGGAWLRYGLAEFLPSGFLVRNGLRLSVVVLFVAWLTSVFHFAPNHHTPWRFDLAGAGVTAASWATLTFGFARYLRLASGANEVVGVVGAVVAAATLVYLMNLSLLIGAEINAIIAARAGVIQQPGTVTLRRRSRR